MLKLLALLPGALLVVTAPAFAQTAPQQPPQPAQQAQAQPQQQQANATPALDPNRKICKTEELIGSRLGTSRVCKTAAQWEAERERERKTGQQD